MKKIWGVLVIALSLFLLTACGSTPSTPEQSNNNNKDTGSVDESVTLTWTTGGDGGGWYSAAGGIASLINEKNSNINIKVIPGGALQNVPFITTGEAQLAWGQAPFIDAGVNGVDPFDEVHDNQLAIGTGFSPVYFHFLAGEDTNITSLDEIFEKKLPVKFGVTPVNNSDEMMFRKILEYYGVTYDDIKSWGGNIFHGSYTDQTAEFNNNNVDVLFVELALPGAAITEASNSRKSRLLSIPDEVVEDLGKYSIIEGTIPAGTYPKLVNADEDINSAILETMLVASRDADENVIYEITKIINENKDRLGNIHASLESFDPATATENLNIDLHPGAARYYEELKNK